VPQPAFTQSLLIREQHFGVAEGKPWQLAQDPALSVEEHFARDRWPVLHGADERFPGGESSNDLAVRAASAVNSLIVPHVWASAREGKKGVHIALVSHGLCISHLITELLKKNAAGHPGGDYRGLMNTGWSRVEVDVKVAAVSASIERAFADVVQASKEGIPMEIPDEDLPPLSVKVTNVNEHSHITDVVRHQLSSFSFLQILNVAFRNAKVVALAVRRTIQSRRISARFLAARRQPWITRRAMRTTKWST
jgi:broad specificity phosphatase PhoE